ncbi:hypothetical protein [Romboutsia sp. 1001713B170207_170306_H8]|nr:hypothetical protein [Romboutsia sp. 1001713B170207_170306_H8]SCI40675.1 Uncharacterised protein [uncultured Clostridium sp.]
MELYTNGILYMGIFSMIFNGLIKIMAIYTMYLAIKSFKIYISKNS